MKYLTKIPALLFGLLFASGGFFILAETALPVWQDWSAMRSWQLNYAQLISVSGSETRTEASYRYWVNGVGYRGSRVYVAGFSDNIGSYQRELRSRLDEHMRTSQAIPIWVNPLDLRQAVIDRDMRWGLFALMSGFCSIFISIGLLVIFFGLRPDKAGSGVKRPSLFALRREWRQKQKDPDFNASFIEYSQARYQEFVQKSKSQTESIDWQTRKGWETANIGSEARKGALAIWVIAIIWNAISTPLLLVLPREWEGGNYAVLLGLLFPLVGIFLIYKAVLSTLEYRRFGKLLFEMDPYPGAIGGHVGGRIQVGRLAYSTANDPTAELAVRLECIYSYVSGSGDSRSRRENIKWAEQGQPRLEAAGRGVRMSFRFELPDDLPEADVGQSDAYHFWRLSLVAKIEGIDLNRKYNIPVFKTGASSRFIRHDISAQVSKLKQQESEAARESIAQGNFDLPGLSRAMRLTQAGDEIRLFFPMFRNRVLTLIALIFAGGFGFASYHIIGMALKGGLFGVVTGLFSVPFFLVALLAAIATIYLAFNDLQAYIMRDGVWVLRRLLFIPIYRRHLRVDEITRLSIKRSGSTGQGVAKIEHFKLLAHDRFGKSITIAEDIDGEDVASHFRDYLARLLDVEV